ncbi:protease SohB [Solimonas marina]|uniref:Protease SohB n=1 Tax=Solimonas marina TaxID=2714601 RepID=A0A970B8Q4_9GAMM|nr:protease SohB [Solimonas marina]NKF21621.1 protease SohB [Solimonas marina]
MSEFLTQYALFFAKALTWVIAVGGLAILIFGLAREARGGGGAERLDIRNLNRRYERLADAIRDEVLDEAQHKALEKERQADEKKRRKQAKKGQSPDKPRVYALQFHGDLQASAVDSLREEISAVLQVARPGQDEVVLQLESEGGMVHGYGLAASQLVRLRSAGIGLTVAIDKVAASGGYLMACVADRIVAAPFAIVGSIGVVAQLPNFHRLLQRMNVDYELHTAGDFKRTLTLFGENTDAGREKFREEIEQTHALFKRFVADYRPSLEIERVATGEHWFGSQALELGLVDLLQTSDDYLLARSREADLLGLSFRRRQRLTQRLSEGLVRLGLGLRRSVEETALPRWR